jgi:hypothetical protein
VSGILRMDVSSACIIIDANVLTCRDTGVAIVCAILTLVILMKRYPRIPSRQRITSNPCSVRYKFYRSSSHQQGTNDSEYVDEMMKSTLEEFQYHLPLNNQKTSAPPSRSPSIAVKSNQRQQQHHAVEQIPPIRRLFHPHQRRNARPKPSTSARPSTSHSRFSETFERPVTWFRRSLFATSTDNPSAFWQSNTSAANDRSAADDRNDIEWHPPGDWEVLEPTEGSSNMIAIPVPALLRPPLPTADVRPGSLSSCPAAGA